MLNFADGTQFATGAIAYQYRPATDRESTNRIILPIEIENEVAIEAVIDTGAPYVVIDPLIARRASLDRLPSLHRETLLVRGTWFEGNIIRLGISLVASQGESLTVEATAFIPERPEYWGNFPSFLGLSGFLERIRFAIDPTTDTFYFGPLP